MVWLPRNAKKCIFFTPFSPFSAKNFFFSKIRLHHFFGTIKSYLDTKNQKKLWGRSSGIYSDGRTDVRTDGRMDGRMQIYSPSQILGSVQKVRGNQSRFMNKELRKAIMNRARLKSRYFKNKTSKDRIELKKQRNLCITLRKKAIKSDFDKAFSNIISNSKPFYDIMKPYLTKVPSVVVTSL